MDTLSIFRPLNDKIKSKGPWFRRALLFAACVGNAVLFASNNQRRSGSEHASKAEDVSGPVHRARQTDRTDKARGVPEYRKQSALMAGPKSEPESTKRFITVPVSFFSRAGLGGSSDFFDSDKGILNESGKEVLGLDETKGKEVSAIVQNSAERLVEIQKRFAKVKSDGPNTWTVEIAPEANAAKAASVSVLLSDIRSILPAGKAEFLAEQASFYFRLGATEQVQTFLVKRDGDSIQITSRTHPYMFNSTMSGHYFRSSRLSWIDGVIKQQAP